MNIWYTYWVAFTAKPIRPSCARGITVDCQDCCIIIINNISCYRMIWNRYTRDIFLHDVFFLNIFNYYIRNYLRIFGRPKSVMKCYDRVVGYGNNNYSFNKNSNDSQLVPENRNVSLIIYFFDETIITGSTCRSTRDGNMVMHN